MIYAQTISIAANSVVEVFTELGISPLRCEVTVQLEGSGTNPVLYLCQDSAGTDVGPALDSEGVSASGGDLVFATFRFFTDKDPVYLKNTSGSGITVAVALTDHA